MTSLINVKINVKINGERQSACPLRSGTKQGHPLSPFPLECTGDSSQGIRRGKKEKKTRK